MKIRYGAGLLLLLLLSACGVPRQQSLKSAALDPDEPVRVIDDLEPPVETDQAASNAAEPQAVDQEILIAIDPGHQAWDVDMSAPEPNAPGSDVRKAKATTGTSGSYSGVPEYELNLAVSLLLRDELNTRGYDVVLTREDNQTAISNAERAQLANEAGADIYLRIHANGSEDSGVHGALALVPSGENAYVGALAGDSQRLGQCVLSAYCAATGFSDRGIQFNDTMTGMNWSKIPVIILEMGFMTNESDDLQMADDAFRRIMAQGIADGIDQYYEEK